jgi:hypothetical protein
MTEEERELEKKYFRNFIELGELASHNLANYEHTFSSFGDCEECGATVHIDQILKHAKWHNKIDGYFKEIVNFLNSKST